MNHYKDVRDSLEEVLKESVTARLSEKEIEGRAALLLLASFITGAMVYATIVFLLGDIKGFIVFSIMSFLVWVLTSILRRDG